MERAADSTEVEISPCESCGTKLGTNSVLYVGTCGTSRNRHDSRSSETASSQGVLNAPNL
jgi:hypothetical protein